MKQKLSDASALTYLLSKDIKIIEALISKNGNLIDLKPIIPQIEKYKNDTNLWMQIVDSDGYSFYRSWTDKSGDHIASERIDISNVIKNHKPMQSVSAGIFDMTIKSIYPIHNDGKFIGIVEIISKFDSIVNNLKDDNIESLIMLDESYSEKLINPYTKIFIDKRYVVNSNASKKFMEKVKREGVDKFLIIKDYKLLENYLVTTDQIKDINNSQMGFFIFFFEKSNLEKHLLDSLNKEYFQTIIIILIVLTLISFYLISRNYARQLTKDIANKTSELKQQQKDM